MSAYEQEICAGIAAIILSCGEVNIFVASAVSYCVPDVQISSPEAVN